MKSDKFFVELQTIGENCITREIFDDEIDARLFHAKLTRTAAKRTKNKIKIILKTPEDDECLLCTLADQSQKI